jgi:rare lipoprotein A
MASYYGKGYWQGRKMANGQRFDYRKLTAACWFLPLGTQVQVTNLTNGKTVVVEITDRGPAHHLHRVIDLSQAAADQLDFVRNGLALVWVHPLIRIETVNAVVPQTDADKAEIAGIIEQ